MKFIFNFIFFGLLFFIIWHYFPDAFKTLVGWATATFEFLKNLGQELIDRINSSMSHPKPEGGHEPVKTLFTYLLFYIK